MTDVETNDTPAAVAPQDATAAAEKAPGKKTTSRKKRLPQGPKKLARAKSHKAARKGQKSARPAKPRPQSKGAQILALIGRSKGATLAEIRKATGWQAHSVRGFISTAGKRHGVKIKSSKSESGDRVYQITK